MEQGKRPVRSLEERLAQRDEALRLHKEGLSYGVIAAQLGVPGYTFSEWVRGKIPKRIGRYEPDLSPSRELAYLIGFYLGEGRSAGKEPKVRFKLADREQIVYVNRLVARLLFRTPKLVKMDGGFYAVDYDSVRLANYLERPLEQLKDCIERFATDFLRGFFDAEGYVSCIVNPRTRRITKFVVGVANTNVAYLRLVEASLSKLGIHTYFRTTNRKGQKMTIRGRTWIRRRDVHHLVLTGTLNVRSFQRPVGFANPTKSAELRDVVAMSFMPPQTRYAFFTPRYQKKGRKWVRKAIQA